MHTFSFLHKKMFAFSIGAVVFILLALIISPIGNYVDKRRINEKQIEKVINQKINLANQWLKKIQNGNFPGAEKSEALFQEEGIALFFKNDSLDWWSTHAVPLQDNWTDYATGKSLLLNGNGIYLPISQTYEGEFGLALILIKREFPYQNVYLPNHYQKDLQIPDYIGISLEKGEHNIYSPDKEFLFSMHNIESYSPSLYAQTFSSIAWVLAFFFLSALLYVVYLRLLNFRARHIIIIIGFSIDILLIRAVMFWFRFPASLHQTSLFQPDVYAASAYIPSLGDLLLHAITLAWISWVAFRHVKRIRWKSIPAPMFKWGLALLGNLVIAFLALGAGALFKSLILDSLVNFGLDDPFKLSWFSLIGYFCVFLVFLSWFMLAYRWTWLVHNLRLKTLPWLITILLAVFIGFLGSDGDISSVLMLGGVLLLLVLLMAHHRGIAASNKLTLGVICLIGISALLTVLLQVHSDHNEKEKRKLLAIRMTQSRDQLAEFLFDEMKDKMHADTSLARLIGSSVLDGDEAKVKQYLRQHYFSEYWEKFEMMVTVCAPGRLLEVKPANYVIECKAYFRSLTDQIGMSSGVDSLYFIDLGIDNSSYLAILPFKHPSLPNGHVTLFLEIYPRHVPRGMGYPELLIDESINQEPLRDYAYAIYKNQELIRRVGKYYYPSTLASYASKHEDASFFDEGGYSHYLKIINNSTCLLISLPKKSLLDLIAPFSYLLVFSSLLMLLVYSTGSGAILHSGRKERGEGLTLRVRLQFSMVMVVLVSFILVALASLWFLTRINQNKNYFALSEKAHSVLIELEHKLSDFDRLGDEETGRIQELLTKFSLVFFSDINLYGTDGRLLASSRKRIFDEGLVSHRMNAEAWYRLTKNHESMVILQECIGDYPYLSAYVPFLNSRNELLAYLNLPYFARQAELRQEIAGFLVAIINIYVILIALTLATALAVSRFITKPLQLIGDKIKRVRLGDINDRIVWYRRDEIGKLVEEYNRMVDQLAESAALLASTERDLAWREMAKQVAHEIKNPLTPMKLSVQYLERAWDDKAPDWEERLKRFTATLIEQIDTLSDIATAFSDFARMPKSKEGLADLAQVAMMAVETYKNHPGLHIALHWDPKRDYVVQADRYQLLRVFNNLLKNAIQAIGEQSDGQVAIDIKSDYSTYMVSIADNGPGIPEDRRAKIFTPNFTTKSSGMGLGLAIVKNIIQSFDGEVWYESEEGKGSIFHFSLPLHSSPAIADRD